MTKKTATLGLFTAIAIIFGYLETLLPVFAGIPGIKLGLANLSVLFVLERYAFKEALLVSAIRIVVIGFLFTTVFSILYSLAGALLSMTVMEIMIRRTRSSIYAISMAGGITHNIGQLIIACFLVRNSVLLYYAPVLMITGILTGFLIGYLTTETLRRVPGGKVRSLGEEDSIH